ncbi:nucleotidyltransferase [Virgibacillus soli]
MPKTIYKKGILEEMIEQLDLPEYVVEKTIQRYKSLGEWFNRENSTFKDVDINIFPQGSFALGTTIKPISEQEEYDLDMGCKINVPNFKSLFTQEQLKEMIGTELESYRVAKGIKQELEEKHRCWRLEYMDEIKFHLDIVPCIPLNIDIQSVYKKQLEDVFNYEESLNKSVVDAAINITDDRLDNYSIISQDWNISNPEGYLKWFESRMTMGDFGIYNRSSITPVPIYSRKTILQRCIQLLKRHRDNMFGDDDSKPISIIITTLAARAYNGELNLGEALINLLENMPTYINPSTPRVPNPVNPNEDFTDRWDTLAGKKLDLEGNFKNWLLQAKVDFNNLLKTESYETASLILSNKFSLNIDNSLLNKTYNLNGNKQRNVTSLPINPPKPWGDAY